MLQGGTRAKGEAERKINTAKAENAIVSVIDAGIVSSLGALLPLCLPRLLHFGDHGIHTMSHAVSFFSGMIFPFHFRGSPLTLPRVMNWEYEHTHYFQVAAETLYFSWSSRESLPM